MKALLLALSLFAVIGTMRADGLHFPFAFWKKRTPKTPAQKGNSRIPESDVEKINFSQFACKPRVIQAITRAYLTSLYYIFENGSRAKRKLSYASEGDLYYLGINARTKNAFLKGEFGSLFQSEESDPNANFKVDINESPHLVFVRFFDEQTKSYSPYFVYSFEGGQEIKNIGVAEVTGSFAPSHPRKHSSRELTCPEQNFDAALSDFELYHWKQFQKPDERSKAQNRFREIQKAVYREN
jgi:hypothetical protein